MSEETKTSKMAWLSIGFLVSLYIYKPLRSIFWILLSIASGIGGFTLGKMNLTIPNLEIMVVVALIGVTVGLLSSFLKRI